MGYKVSIDDPKFAKGDEVGISGLCAVPNGGSTTVSDEQAEVFSSLHGGMSVEDAFKDSETVKVAKAADPKVDTTADEKSIEDMDAEAAATTESEKGGEG